MDGGLTGDLIDRPTARRFAHLVDERHYRLEVVVDIAGNEEDR